MFGKKKREKKPKKTSKKGLSKNDLAEKLEDGWIRALVTFEIVGKPKKHIEDSLKIYLANLKKDPRIEVLSEETAEAIEQEELWSTFSEVEMIVDEMATLVWIAMNFSPASIEIMEPSQKILQIAEMNAWLNDLLSQLHQIALEMRDTKQKNIKLNESLNALIVNIILTSLETGNLSAKELQKKIGIHQDQLKPFLDNLVSRKRIKKAGDTYSL